MDCQNRDKIWISETDFKYVFDFIDNYIEERRISRDGENEYIIKNAIDIYPGRLPIMLNDLTEFLDKKLRIKKNR